jgi:hypothetical protein
VHHHHDLNHVEIDAPGGGDREHSIRHNLGELVCHGRVDLGPQRCCRNFQQQRSVNLSLGLEGVEHLECLSLGNLVTIGHNTRVHAFVDPAFGLLEHLADQDHIGCCAIASHVILHNTTRAGVRVRG